MMENNQRKMERCWKENFAKPDFGIDYPLVPLAESPSPSLGWGIIVLEPNARQERL